MLDYLFDTPLWLLGLLAITAVALWVSGNGRQEKRLQYAAYGLIAVAVALFLVSGFVDTDREKVAKRTRQVVEAVEKKDRAALARLLHPDVTLMWMRKQQIVDRAGTAVDEFRLSNVRTTSLDTVQPNRAEVVVDVAVAATVESAGRDAPTTWELVWARSGNEWLLRDIKAKRLPGIDLETLIGRMRP